MFRKRAYWQLLLEFGEQEFTVEQAGRILHSRTPTPLLLHRLCSDGFLERVSRGRFRVLNPFIVALREMGFDWRDKVKQKAYLPMLDFVVARLVSGLLGRLRSLIVFGSIASGRAKPESDVDLLVVSEGLPGKYSDRLRLFNSLVEGVEKVRLRLWRSEGIYPLLDPILLLPEEALISHPFYIDMWEEHIIVYDRDRFMEKKLEQVKAKLMELGARKVIAPDGSWFWLLKPSVHRGEVVSL